MPTVSIVYSLPEEEEEYQVHMDAAKYAIALLPQPEPEPV